MKKKATRRTSKRRSIRSEALVLGHLERVSRRLLEEHFDVVRRFIGRSPGIYALYRKDRLYYVGLASGLSGRLRAHIRDKHKASWDHFSMYLTIKDQHIKELESLLLRIVAPTGNRVSGRVAGSKNLQPRLLDFIREQNRQDLHNLFGIRKKAKQLADTGVKASDQVALAKLFPEGARIRAASKGKTWRATIGKDGNIRFEGQRFKSLSGAARAALKRAVNGWWFWNVERTKGHWVRLIEARRIGTPIYRAR